MALNPTLSKSDLEQAAKAGCDRLVLEGIVEPSERARQRRLVGTVLAAPFILAVALATTLSEQGLVTLLGALCAIFAICWSIALFVAVTGRARLAQGIALSSAALALAALLGLAGGLSSPLAALTLALPIEAYWIARRREAAGWGGLAMVAALALQAPIAEMAGFGAGAATPWHWLAPLAYAATAALRLPWMATMRANADKAADVFSLEDRMPAAVLRIAENGEVLEISPQAESVLGIQPELLLGQGLFERIRITDRVAYRCALSDLAGGAPSRSVELWLRQPGAGGGRSAHRLFEADLIGAGDRRAVAILRPAAELAELRAALARAEEAAGSTEAAKGRFLATVSHELRTPLNAIIGFSEMMLHEAISGTVEGKQKEHLTLIRDAGRHLLSVVNSILDISKIEAGTYRIHPEAFDFETAAQLCHSMLQPQAAEKQLKMSMRIAHGLNEVRCDQRAVQQILINLLSNAVKFTREGGSVTLEACLQDDRLAIRVSDTGIGMSEEELAGIGQPFAQVSNDYTRQYEGTGLGLCLVRGLVKLHGGEMTIESAPGLGTSVTVTLPQEIKTTGKADGEKNSGSGRQEKGEGFGEDHEALRRIA